MTTAAPAIRTALVTGASRGIGAAITRALHRDGAFVLAHYGSDRDSAQQLADELGDRIHLLQADLLDPDAPAQLWQSATAAARERGSDIDVVVNNAGAWIASSPTDEQDWNSGWDSNLTLNLRAPADICRQAVLHFVDNSGGILINITSRSAHRGDDAQHLAYGAAKGGLLALTKGIARGYARAGVLAYAVAPGWVATDISAGADLMEAAANLPLGEITPARDVAEVVAFLATGRARHATGCTVDITGADYVR